MDRRGFPQRHDGRRSPEDGRWLDVYISHRSDQAILRSLRTGRRKCVRVRSLILHEDEGLSRDDLDGPAAAVAPLGDPGGFQPTPARRASISAVTFRGVQGVPDVAKETARATPSASSARIWASTVTSAAITSRA